MRPSIRYGRSQPLATWHSVEFNMPGASLILRVICLGVLTSEAALNGPVRPEKLSRRALLAGTLAMPLLVAVPQKGSTSEDGPQDPRTTWSFFGLVAPPIQATWSYDTLVEQAKAENIATIQTATSHDCVVATGHDGMRFVSMVADDAIPALLIATQKSDGSLPFEVLPIDPNRAAVRDVATQFLNLLGVLWLADQADLLPWDTTPYGSIAEREAAQRGGEKVKMKLLTRLRSTFEKKKKKAPTVLKRRVAAGELRACPALPPVALPHAKGRGCRSSSLQANILAHPQAWITTRRCAAY